jgi:putative ABC transport system permease protein
MQTLSQDLRFGVRLLLKNPGFTLIAVMALTLGIGANSAIFSVVNSVLLRPLPYQESDRLVFLSERSPQLEGMSISYPNFKDWREQNQVFENIGVYRRQSYNLTGIGEPERLTGGIMSADLLAALRVKPALGRSFTNEEDKPGGTPVVLLSHGLWQRRFGGDPAIVNQTLTLNGVSYTVIGIMPPDYRFPSRVELYAPVGQESGQASWQNRGNHPGLYGVARLKPGVTIEQARANMDAIAVNLEKQYPQSNMGNRASLTPMIDIIVRDVRPRLYVLLGAVGFVLLIACANVANLLLARATTRQREIALRTALGASRWRVVRQLLTESVLLAVIGGALGLLLAKWGVKAILAISPNSIPRAQEVGLDGRAVAFTVLISIVTGIVFGLAPALQASRLDLNESLKEAGRGSTGRRHWFRSSLVVSEIALTLVLLVGAGLLIRSFYHLQKVDPGFISDNLLTFNVSLPQSKYSTEPQRINFYDQVLLKIRALPGVEAVGMASGLPLGNNGWQSGFVIEGRPAPPPGQNPLTEVAYVSPDYFHAMRMTFLKGRNFSEQDIKSAPRVTIIDEEFARRHWPESDPIGQQIRVGGNPTTIIAIVRRVKMEGLATDSNRVQSYYPYQQNPLGGMTIVLRTKGDPAELATSARLQVQSVDKDQPIFLVQTMEQIWNDSIAPERLNLMLLIIFAGVALALAAIGIYGVMAYSVTQRTHEIGVRMALGAQRTDILKHVVGQGMLLVIIGIAIGLGTAFAVTRLMKSLLFGVSASDPMTFSAVAIMLALIALFACFFPARKAMKVDPMVALRYE